MINNDIYRRLRYLFGYHYDHVVALFAATGFEVSEAQYKGWAGKEEEDRFIMMTDRESVSYTHLTLPTIYSV